MADLRHYAENADNARNKICGTKLQDWKYAGVKD